MAMKYALIVDDEKDLVDIYVDVLSSIERLKVITAHDGMDAYRKARNQKFDFIITDYKMPRLDGVQLILALRDNNINDQTPIIVVSAYPENVKTEIKKAKVDKNITIFSKPIDFKFMLNFANDLLIESDKSNKKSIDVDFLNPFLASIQQVIQEMGQISDVKNGKLEIHKDRVVLKTEISSYLAVVSPGFRGTFIMTFPEQTFLKLTTKALGETFEKISDENKDFAGELSNIIFGNTKRLWIENGFIIEKAIPHVQTGVSFSMPASEKIPSIVIPFNCEFGEFYAVISMLWN